MASTPAPATPPATFDPATAYHSYSNSNAGSADSPGTLAPGAVGVQRTTLDSSGKPGGAPAEGEFVDGVRCELEDFTRCSDSHLWKLMMSFYDRKGIESWSQGVVPHFITCNAFIGRAYAKVRTPATVSDTQGEPASRLGLMHSKE